MKERPILFFGEMVRAILDGRKTMTRRVLKPQPTKSSYIHHEEPDGIAFADPCSFNNYRYMVGDRLWVRETWRRSDENCPDGIYYKADNLLIWFDGNEPIEARNNISKYPRDAKNRPSIFMPRWASRITLEITNIRVERLQEITNEDAIKEGVNHSKEDDDCSCHLSVETYRCDYKSHRRSFCILWDKINGKKTPWSSNPWVWVIEFRRIKA